MRWGASPLIRWAVRIPPLRCALLLALAAMQGACEQGDREVTITETRRLTLWDQSYPLGIKDRAPRGWRQVPSTMMRPLNYRFGEGEEGEVYLSVVSPGPPNSNLSRWRRQFGLGGEAALEEASREEILGTAGYLVELEGTYSPGMGREPREGMAMCGAVVPMEDRTVTVKMIGPAELVAASAEEFRAYCRSLELREAARLADPES